MRSFIFVDRFSDSWVNVEAREALKLLEKALDVIDKFGCPFIYRRVNNDRFFSDTELCLYLEVVISGHSGFKYCIPTNNFEIINI